MSQDIVGVVIALTEIVPSKENQESRTHNHLTDARYSLQCEH